MDRHDLTSWIEGYERLWRSPGTGGLATLFSDDVRYSPSPWATPVIGPAALARFWDAERDGPDEGFTIAVSVVAVDGDVGVARAEVHYADGQVWRDLWVIRLGTDGRCVEFEEWPFAPGDDDGH